mgnify:CR=1 FL=1|tara:strand:+ start:104 stop:310 length:207 start_codon:yes stop_codon:yes gene_type:complete
MSNRDKLNDLMDEDWLKQGRWAVECGFTVQTLHNLRVGEAVFTPRLVQGINETIEKQIEVLKRSKLKY